MKIHAYFITDKRPPSIRLLTALGLYFDSVVIPIVRVSDESELKGLERFPAEKRFLEENNSFYDRHKCLESNLFRFPNLLEQGEVKSRITTRRINSTLSKVMRSFDIDDPQQLPLTIFPLLQVANGYGCHAGIQEVIEERDLPIAPIVISDHNTSFALPPNNTDKNLADVLASWLAVESIALSLPDLEAVHPLEIMRAREALADELLSFRTAMYRLVKELRALVKESISPENISSEAAYLAKTTILPAVYVLRERIRLERKTFARRIIIRTMDAFKILANYCLSPDPIKLANLASETALGVLDFSSYCDELSKLKNEAAISYLAKLPNQFSQRTEIEGAPTRRLGLGDMTFADKVKSASTNYVNGLKRVADRQTRRKPKVKPELGKASKKGGKK